MRKVATRLQKIIKQSYESFIVFLFLNNIEDNFNSNNNLKNAIFILKNFFHIAIILARIDGITSFF